MTVIKDNTYNAPAAFTITLASLASSTAGLGRQATEIDNTSTLFNRIEISASIKMGTSPTANTSVYFYLIRNNNAGTPIRDDGAGASDAGWTQKSAQQIGYLSTGAAPSTGDTLSANWIIYDVGAKFSIGVVNSSGASLDSTGSNHVVSYNGITLQNT